MYVWTFTCPAGEDGRKIRTTRVVAEDFWSAIETLRGHLDFNLKEQSPQHLKAQCHSVIFSDALEERININERR